ncbi:uncharacterized protein LOC106468873 [Limulus polyphemus]|uniref:Uncharacterized protein LOC106468873 n=1 Tax=Limulus polyphemus TaxID=6850 RepID=A0ABM1BM49_LIMPO|nr:uncharacterized protein LOC106468873 [Limulus polyphemus]XP_022253705.1 uncharacterized protein LOC106468873 [Limulus polyphemus]XP_022253713.1 uncharacterized protein LOC106468873 [Limulus polyphemus]
MKKMPQKSTFLFSETDSSEDDIPTLRDRLLKQSGQKHLENGPILPNSKESNTSLYDCKDKKLLREGKKLKKSFYFNDEEKNECGTNCMIVPETPSPILMCNKRRKQEHKLNRPKRTCLNYKLEDISTSVQSNDVAETLVGEDIFSMSRKFSVMEKKQRSKNTPLSSDSLPHLTGHQMTESIQVSQVIKNKESDLEDTSVVSSTPFSSSTSLCNSDNWFTTHSSNSSCTDFISSEISSDLCIKKNLPTRTHNFPHCKTFPSVSHPEENCTSSSSTLNSWTSSSKENPVFLPSFNTNESTSEKNAMKEIQNDIAGCQRLKKNPFQIIENKKASSTLGINRNTKKHSTAHSTEFNFDQSVPFRKYEATVANNKPNLGGTNVSLSSKLAPSTLKHRFHRNVLQPLISPFKSPNKGVKYVDSESDEDLFKITSLPQNSSVRSQQDNTSKFCNKVPSPVNQKQSSLEQHCEKSNKQTPSVQISNGQTICKSHSTGEKSYFYVPNSGTNHISNSDEGSHLTVVGQACKSWPSTSNSGASKPALEKEKRLFMSAHSTRRCKRYQDKLPLVSRQQKSLNSINSIQDITTEEASGSVNLNSTDDCIPKSLANRSSHFHHSKHQKSLHARGQRSQLVERPVHERTGVSYSHMHSQGTLSLAHLNPDLYDAELESEEEIINPISHTSPSEIKNRTDILSQMGISVSRNIRPGEQGSGSSRNRQQDHSSDDEVIMISNHGPCSSSRNLSRGMCTDQDWRSVDSDTTGTPSNSDRTPPSDDREVVVVSPDPVAQVNQMEEDERLARILQAQFDAEQNDGDTSDSLGVIDSDLERVPPVWDLMDMLATTSTSSEGSISSLSQTQRGSTSRRFSTRSSREAARSHSRRSSRTRVRGSRRHYRRWTSPRGIVDRYHHHPAMIYAEVIMGLGDGLADSNDYETLLNLTETLGDAVARGLSRTDINRLPTRNFTQLVSSENCESVASCDDGSRANNNTEMRQKECQVCLSSYEEGEVLRILPCFHDYHASCIDKWLKNNRSCPTCRVEVSFDE